MKTVLIIFLFSASLMFNIALLASQTVFEMASSAFTALTDMPTGASKIHPKNTKVNFKGEKVTVAEAVGSTANGVKRRAAKTAAKSVSAMAFEAAPFIGTTAIVGVTLWELNDLCETAKDMDALNRALNPDETPSEERTSVCSVKVPSVSELKESLSNQTQNSVDRVNGFLSDLK